MEQVFHLHRRGGNHNLQAGVGGFLNTFPGLVHLVTAKADGDGYHSVLYGRGNGAVDDAIFLAALDGCQLNGVNTQLVQTLGNVGFFTERNRQTIHSSLPQGIVADKNLFHRNCLAFKIYNRKTKNRRKPIVFCGMINSSLTTVPPVLP